MTTTDHLDGQSIVRYHATGNRTFTIDAEQRVTTYTYDSLYRLTGVTNAEQESTTYQYDALGNKLFVTDLENTITRYMYPNQGKKTIQSLHVVCYDKTRYYGWA
jgi:YD repeat-containing protein